MYTHISCYRNQSIDNILESSTESVIGRKGKRYNRMTDSYDNENPVEDDIVNQDHGKYM